MCADELVGGGLGDSPHNFPESKRRAGGNASACADVGFVRRKTVRAYHGRWRSKRKGRRMKWVSKNQATLSHAVEPSEVIEPSLALTEHSLESPSEEDHCGLHLSGLCAGSGLAELSSSEVGSL